jgi:hypothetical protein
VRESAPGGGRAPLRTRLRLTCCHMFGSRRVPMPSTSISVRGVLASMRDICAKYVESAMFLRNKARRAQQRWSVGGGPRSQELRGPHDLAPNRADGRMFRKIPGQPSRMMPLSFPLHVLECRTASIADQYAGLFGRVPERLAGCSGIALALQCLEAGLARVPRGFAFAIRRPFVEQPFCRLANAADILDQSGARRGSSPLDRTACRPA